MLTPPGSDLPPGVAAPNTNSPPGTASGVQQDAASREALKVLAAITKNSIIAILNSVFDTPQTPAEKRAAQEQQEVAAAATTAANQDPAAAISTAAAGASRKPTSVNDTTKTERPFDPDLACPVGIEATVCNEVLRLRQARMASEVQLGLLQEQLTQARAIVDRRREEGASKLLLKKLEKQQDEGKRRLAELARMKIEEELIAKSNLALLAASPPREKSAGKTRGGAK